MQKAPRRRLRSITMTFAVAGSIVTALLLSSVAGASPRHAKAKSPINVLYVSEQSGALAGVGSAFLHGGVTGARIINQTGGILGHPVTLKIVDSASNPATAVTLVQQALASGTHYAAIVADVGVISGAISPIVATHPDIFYAGAAATAAQTIAACPNCYFSGPNQFTQALGAVWWANKLGYKSIGLATGDNANGRSYSGYYKQLATRYHMSYSEVFAPLGTIDASPQLQQLLSNHPDVLVMPGSGSASMFVPARAKLGSTAPVICDQGCAGSTDWGSFAAGVANGVKVLTLPFLIANDPTTKTAAYRVYLKYLAKVETTHPLGFNAGLTSYENMLLMRAAAKKCGCIDPATWIKVLETVKSSKQVSAWVGPTTLFASNVRSLIYPPSYYQMVPAKALVDGFWTK